MRLRLAVVLALTLALAACGVVGGGPEKDTAGSGSTKVAMDGALPNVAEGTLVPASLRDFTCTRDDEGTWTASGAVVNDSKESATFKVTVHVGPADGAGAVARTKRIASVQAHGSVRFDLGKIETRSDDGPCHVQVLAL